MHADNLIRKWELALGGAGDPCLLFLVTIPAVLLLINNIWPRRKHDAREMFGLLRQNIGDVVPIKRFYPVSII